MNDDEEEKILISKFEMEKLISSLDEIGLKEFTLAKMGIVDSFCAEVIAMTLNELSKITGIDSPSVKLLKEENKIT